MFPIYSLGYSCPGENRFLLWVIMNPELSIATKQNLNAPANFTVNIYYHPYFYDSFNPNYPYMTPLFWGKLNNFRMLETPRTLSVLIMRLIWKIVLKLHVFSVFLQWFCIEELINNIKIYSDLRPWQKVIKYKNLHNFIYRVLHFW